MMLPWLFCSCWGYRCWGSERAGDESADAAVTMLFAGMGVDVEERDCGDESCGRCCYQCYLQLSGVDVGVRDCGDESADAAVTMLFAGCWV